VLLNKEADRTLLNSHPRFGIWKQSRVILFYTNHIECICT